MINDVLKNYFLQFFELFLFGEIDFKFNVMLYGFLDFVVMFVVV